MSISLLLVVLNNNYPMNWVSNTEEQSADVELAKSHLSKLGVPKHVLDDLTNEEILAFKDASYAVVDEEDMPLNEGRNVTENNTTTTVYDVYELHITQVALRMADDGNTWRIINHFKWNENSYFIGTEAIAITGDNVADINGKISGRLLYRKNEQTYSSEYYKIDKEPHTTNFFGHTFESNYVFAGFSFDRLADNYSGYMTYEIVGKYGELNDAGNKPLIYVEMDYYHQKTMLLYPSITSLDYAKGDYFTLNAKEFDRARVSFDFIVTELETTP